MHHRTSNDENLSGAVLIDTITLENSLRFLSRGQVPFGNLLILSLANFIESLILYDILYVDKDSFDRSRILNEYFDRSIVAEQLSSLVKPLPSKDIEYDIAKNIAAAINASVDMDSLRSQACILYPNLSHEYGMSSGYWYGEFGLVTPYRDFNYDGVRNRVRVLDSVEKFRSLVVELCALRAWFYLGLSMEKNIMYVPNDFRALFIDHVFKNMNTARVVLRKLEQIFNKKVEENAKWFDESYPNMKLRVPLIFNYVMSKVSKLSDIVPVALHVRDSRPACQFRKTCGALDKARKEGDVASVSNIIKEMNLELKRIEQMEDTKSGFDISLTFPPALDFDVNAIRTWRKRRHLVFLRQVFDGSSDPRLISKSIAEGIY